MCTYSPLLYLAETIKNQKKWFSNISVTDQPRKPPVGWKSVFFNLKTPRGWTCPSLLYSRIHKVRMYLNSEMSVYLHACKSRVQRHQQEHHSWLIPSPFASHAFHCIDGTRLRVGMICSACAQSNASKYLHQQTFKISVSRVVSKSVVSFLHLRNASKQMVLALMAEWLKNCLNFPLLNYVRAGCAAVTCFDHVLSFFV